MIVEAMFRRSHVNTLPTTNSNQTSLYYLLDNIEYIFLQYYMHSMLSIDKTLS